MNKIAVQWSHLSQSRGGKGQSNLIWDLTQVVSMRLCVLVTWAFGGGKLWSFLGGVSSRHSSSAKDTRLLYHSTLLLRDGFDGSCSRFKSLLKLKLRLIGCRPRFIAVGNLALFSISDPIFRRNEPLRSTFPPFFAAPSACSPSSTLRLTESFPGFPERKYLFGAVHWAKQSSFSEIAYAISYSILVQRLKNYCSNTWTMILDRNWRLIKERNLERNPRKLLSQLNTNQVQIKCNFEKIQLNVYESKSIPSL